MQLFGPVLALLARILMAFAFAFFVPLAWAWYEDAMALRAVWGASFGLAFGSGWLLFMVSRRYQRELLPRDGFLLVNLVWVVLTFFAMVPLLFTVPDITWSKAFFEAMSALTATGATALSGLDDLPVSVNVWRCFLQLVGGLGIVLLVVAVLPLLGLGGMQLYKAETPGPMKDAKFTPRIAETARGLWAVYFVLSAACFFAYRWAGMSWADAFMHMCTTMGLGGLSSHDASFGYWNSAAIEWVATLFMTLAGISFARYFMVWRSRSLKPVTDDREIRMYIVVLLVSVLVVFVSLLDHRPDVHAADTLRAAMFHVVSVATTTGYSSQDYAQWPVALPVLMMFLGSFASCAGSTGGGIKMMRMLILAQQASREMKRLVHPRAVQPVVLGGRVVGSDAIFSVLAFMLVYGATVIVLSMVLLLTDLDPVTAFSAVLASVHCMGPGLGAVGPASTYAVLTDFQLWVCTLGMLLGRLEILSFMALLTPAFWRR